MVLLDAGRHADAREPAEQALRIYRGLGNQVGEDRARNALARVQPSGDPPSVPA